MMGDLIQRYPLLCLLVPYICGIEMADVCYTHITTLGHALAWSVLCLLLTAILAWIWQRKTLFGVAASALFMMIGVWGYTQARSKAEYHWPSKQSFYEARVITEPHIRQRSVMCEMEILAMRDTAAWRKIGRKTLVYIERCEDACQLLPGDKVCFEGVIRAPRNFSDSLEFDYARYVTMQGAAGTIYLSQGCWRETSDSDLSLRERLLRLRHKLQVGYMHQAFDAEASGVISALTLGDKRRLSEEVRAAYTNAGVAHVLALSGLHVGIIYGILAFLVRGVLHHRKLRWIRELLILVVLWLFALMVGFSASVVRSASMCSLYALSRWISRDSNSVNALLIAAFAMLLIHPFYLFDIGFQLSFMAMVPILWLEPHLEVLFHRRSLHPIPAYFIGIICMSLAAQLGTFPLTLYHFGTFSSYFLLTNLVVIPYLNFVLILTIAWWVLALTGLPFSATLENGIQLLVNWVNEFLSWIGRYPGAVLHVEEYSTLETLLTYLLILFTGLFLARKWTKGAVLALASLMLLLLVPLLNLR